MDKLSRYAFQCRIKELRERVLEHYECGNVQSVRILIQQMITLAEKNTQHLNNLTPEQYVKKVVNA